MPRPIPRALERGGASNIRIGPRSGLVVCKRDHWGPLYTNHWVGPRSGLDVKPSGLMCEQIGSKMMAVYDMGHIYIGILDGGLDSLTVGSLDFVLHIRVQGLCN